MIVENLAVRKTSKFCTLETRVVFEDCDREPQTLIFATEPKWEEYLADHANGQLIALSFLATRFGERRVSVKDPVCPRLREGLVTILGSFERLGVYDLGLPQLELNLQKHPHGCRPARSALFLSLGVDSLFSLQRNHAVAPKGHPYRVTDVVMLEGAGFPEDRYHDLETEAFAIIRRRLDPIIRDTGVNAIPIVTNLGTFAKPGRGDDARFWETIYNWVGPVTTSHVLSGGLSHSFISSGTPIWRASWPTAGSLIAPLFSSMQTTIQVGGGLFERVEKLRDVANWPVALANLHVCTEMPDRNCGKCHKCELTMTALAALGKLSECEAFPSKEVNAEKIRSSVICEPSWLIPEYKPLIPLLEQRGLPDLADAVRELISSAKPWVEWRRQVIELLSATVSPDANLVVSDNRELGVEEELAPRNVTPFTEHHGEFWGPPANDQTAVEELRKYIGRPNTDFAVAWPAFWQFDQFPNWSDMLRKHFRLLVDHKVVKIYSHEG